MKTEWNIFIFFLINPWGEEKRGYSAGIGYCQGGLLEILIIQRSKKPSGKSSVEVYAGKYLMPALEQ
jgi:hypothetical protein